ncbi:factor activating pos9 [Lithohypha guttulata]|nr:factor activating pos9 [Lithohypha guttulata]
MVFALFKRQFYAVALDISKYPNVIITGTPGVGKTTTAQELVEISKSSDSPSSSIPLKHLSVNKIAKEENFYESYDEELQTHVVDEDKLLDHIENLIANGAGEGGWIIDWHVCDIFPERWIDLVVVLRCEDTKTFYERLTSDRKAEGGEKRGYTGQKLQENIDAEIFGVIAEEAKEAWPNEGAVVELISEEAEQIEENAERIWEWCKMWVKDNPRDVDGEEG